MGYTYSKRNDDPQHPTRTQMPKSMKRSTITDNRWYKSMLVGNPTYTDYELISTAFGTGSNTEFIFSSIPSTYKHLQIRYTASKSDAQSFLRLQFNSVSSSSYTHHEVGGSNASMGSQNSVNQAHISIRGLGFDGLDNIYAAGFIDILDYSSTSKNTTVRTLAGGSQLMYLNSGLFNSTAAISSIRVFLPSSTFRSGSRFSLYGIKG
jgi:hypothetical protein